MESNVLSSTLPVRIYYEDTDAGGVVYYANYLKFFERGRTEFLRDFDIQQDTLLAGYIISRRHCFYGQKSRYGLHKICAI